MELMAEAARRVAVWKQGFRPTPHPDKARIRNTIKVMGCVQIDSINVVERSHYLALWSRLGPYDKERLDQLLSPDRGVFEYWAHAASIIPIEHYRYYIHAMKEYRKGLTQRAQRRLKEGAALLDQVLEAIRRKGPLSSRDFESRKVSGERRQGWWDWKPAKVALELLFSAGLLMVAYRRNFQRHYDLAENVLPSHVDTTEPTEEERRRFFVESSIDALGVADPRDIASYYHGWSTSTSLRGEPLKQTLGQLLREGTLCEAKVEGSPEPCYMLAKDYEVVEKRIEGEGPVFDGVTFLSPFDNLTWGRVRNRTVFNFTPKLEAYLPRSERKYGYYSMNMLYKDRLVGRLDPKLHRESGVLEVRSLHLDQNLKPDPEFNEKLDSAFKSLIEFTKAKELVRETG